MLTAYTRLLTDGTTVLIGPARPRDGGIKAAPLLYGHLRERGRRHGVAG